MGAPPAADTSYSVQVSHHDGRHASVRSTVLISVFRVSPDDITKRSVFLRLQTNIETSALLTGLPSLLDAGKFAASVSRLVAVQIRGDGVLVVSEKPAATLAASLRGALSLLTLRSSLRIIGVEESPCSSGLSPCSGHASLCTASRGMRPTMHTWDGLQTAVAAPNLTWTPQCACNVGWTGPDCALSTAGCSSTICLNGGTCYAPGKACLCRSGWTGVRCDLREKMCRATNACVNGNCAETTPGAYRCTCNSGWTGDRCDSPQDACSSSPCRNGGTCHRLLGAYRCACPFGTFGLQCEGKSLGFTEGSYSVYSLSDFDRYSLSVEMATAQSDALLLYHQLTRDWHLSLSLRAGRPTLQLYRGTLGALSVTIPIQAQPVGAWLRLTLVKTDTELKLAADRCNLTVWSRDGMDEAGCPNTVCTATSCSKSFTIPASDRDKLSRPSNNRIFIGGLPSGTLSMPGLAAFDLVGCLRRLSGFSSSTPVETSGVLASCPRFSPASLCGAVDSCTVSSARCHDEWFSRRCECPADHQPPSCTPGFKGYSLSPGSLLLYTLRPGILRQESQRRRKRSATAKQASFSVRVTTTETTGVLMHAKTDREYTLLMLLDTKLVLWQSLGGTAFRLEHPTTGLSNGLIHAISLTVHISNGSVVLTVDNVAHTGVSGTTHNFLDASQMAVAGPLEGVLLSNGKKPPGFVGCMSQLRFNNKVQPMTGALAERYNVTVVGSISDKCPVVACNSYRCTEGYQCVDRPTQGWGVAECIINDTAAATVNLLLVVLLPISLILAVIAVGIVTWMCLLRRRHGAPCKRGWPATTFPGQKSVPSQNGGSVTSSDTRRHLNDLIYLQGTGMTREDGPIPPVHPERVAMETLAFNPPVGKMQGTDSSRSTKSFPDSGFQDHHRHMAARMGPVDLLGPPSDSVMMLCGPSSSVDDQLSLPDTEDPYELGPPEQYDLDNASSIAPSDVDVTRHYRHYRRRPAARLPPHAEVPAPPLSPEGTDASGSRIYERLGSQSSATSHDTGPRYPYAYKHRLPAPRPMPSTLVGRGLTVEDVRRLNRQPAMLPPPMTLPTRPHPSITGSSSAGGSRDQFLPLGGSRSHSSRHSVPLRPGESSSDDDGMDSAGGSFTCSEGEDQAPAGQVNRAFAAAAALRHSAASHGHNLVPDQGLPSELDALLRWEPNFNSLIGVFEDLAGLPVQRLNPPGEEFV